MFVSCVVIDKSFFVLADSPFELVNQSVDRGIHILFDMIAVDSAAVDAGGGFGFMPELLDGQDTLDVRHDVKMSANLIYLCTDILSH
jgi:hypothetical protein